MNKPLLLLVATGLLSGCVSMKSYEALESERDELREAQAAARLAQGDAEINRRELEGRVAATIENLDTKCTQNHHHCGA